MNYHNQLDFNSLKTLVRTLNEKVLDSLDLTIKIKSTTQLVEDIELVTNGEYAQISGVYLMLLLVGNVIDLDTIKKHDDLPMVSSFLTSLGNQSISETKRTVPAEVVKRPERKPLIPASRLRSHPIGANSPSLQSDFATIGFTDNNGDLVRGDIAQTVLTELWGKAPSFVQASGYYVPAKILFDTEKDKIETQNGTVARSLKQQNETTIIESNKVTRQGYHTTIQRLILKPYDAVHVVDIDWIVSEATIPKKPQNKRKQQYYKGKVKQKISWGTRYMPDANKLPEHIALGETIRLDGVTCKICFKDGKISLYSQDGITPMYDVGYYVIDKQGFDITWERITPKYQYAFDKAAESLLDKVSKAHTEALAHYTEDSIWSQVGRRLKGNTRRPKLKKARKYVFNRYRRADSLLPLDVKAACAKLDNPHISEKTRVYANNVLLGYYLDMSRASGQR